MVMNRSARYAFFDLDGTLIADASIPAFFKYYLNQESADNAKAIWAEFSQKFSDMCLQGISRDNINSWFYNTYFCSISIARVRELSQQWLNSYDLSQNFFKKKLINYLNAHIKNGIKVVLVTGSFREIVAAIGNIIHIDACLCAPLEEKDGYYTGRLTSEPMIGIGKRLAVEEFLCKNNISPQHCYGYGDDPTDIPFLDILGYPHALTSGDPRLLEYAHQASKWTIIDA